jgi:hypothetical protein
MAQSLKRFCEDSLLIFAEFKTGFILIQAKGGSRAPKMDTKVMAAMSVEWRANTMNALAIPILTRKEKTYEHRYRN